MSVLVDKNTRLVVQGITGSAGAFHTRQCIEYGTNVVAGVTPGKGGQMFDDKIPVFDTVWEAKQKTDCNVSMIFVPAGFAADSILVCRHLHSRRYDQWRWKGSGGEPIGGLSQLDAVKIINEDKETDAREENGEIGGSAEEEATTWIKTNNKKPVAAFIACLSAPAGRRIN